MCKVSGCEQQPNIIFYLKVLQDHMQSIGKVEKSLHFFAVFGIQKNLGPFFDIIQNTPKM
jgi:hypothetical protein